MITGLTEYQKQIVLDNRMSFAFRNMGWLIMLVPIVCVITLLTGEPEVWYTNLAYFGLILYVLQEWVGLVFELLAVLMMKILFHGSKLLDRVKQKDEQFSSNDIGEIKKMDGEMLMLFKKMAAAARPYPTRRDHIGWTVYQVFEKTVDLGLLVLLATQLGMPFLAVAHLVCIPTALLNECVRRQGWKFVKTIPAPEVEETTDKLCDLLFRGGEPADEKPPEGKDK